MQNLILIGEASRILEVSDETVRRYASMGRLTVQLAGKYRLFSRAEVQELAESRRHELQMAKAKK